ncbi:hypothetical protein C1646_758001 [Rhizophagus diaphanus]|nr:hypothetical protein C1646_758001 [Rhizophagus diaphanus] [Rhizophagus sp. MUCL 43196]
MIKKILLDSFNKKIDIKAIREWAKKRYILEEINPIDYRIIVISDNKPVLIVEKMYKVLCKTHAKIDNHVGQKQLWKSIKQNWSFVRQKIVKNSPPTILQSDNRKEFYTDIIKELVNL